MRRVPLDLCPQVGKQTWRWLLAHDLATARLKLPEAIAETDRLIVRGEETPSSAHQTLTRQQDRLMTQGRPELIRELVEVGAIHQPAQRICWSWVSGSSNLLSKPCSPGREP